MKNKEVTGDSKYDFTKGKWHLTNLVAFYDEVTDLVCEGRVTDIIYLDLCKELATVLHETLCLNWTDMNLTERHQSVDTELAGWLHSRNCGQWLHIQVESSDKWCS